MSGVETKTRSSRAARPSVLLALALLTSGCADYQWARARLSEYRGRTFSSIDHYEKFLALKPADPRAAEAHVRLGELYTGIHRCLEARRHFEAAARGFPDKKPWYERAKGGVMGCPDYFPLDPGRTWVYGDSQSRGKNMRLEAEVRLSSGAAGGTILTSLFAGANRIREDRAQYKKADWMVLQRAGEDWAPILRYPFNKGETWRARRDKSELVYTIVSDEAVVKTVAGTFTGCLKVKEFDRRYKGSWKYDYYAPFVGRVATTVGGPGFENPNTELVKFSR